MSARRVAGYLSIAFVLAPPVSARAQAADCLRHTRSGRVMLAALESGITVEITGAAFEARYAGRSARLRVTSPIEVRARARVEHLELRLLEPVVALGGVVFLRSGAPVFARAIDRSEASVDVAIDIALSARVRIPSSSLALDDDDGLERCMAAPGELPASFTTIWERASQSSEHVPRRGRLRLRARPAGPVVASFESAHGRRLRLVEERGGWMHVASRGERGAVAGWVRADELEPARPASPASGGAGLGEGRIGLGCLHGRAQSERARAGTVTAREALLASPNGRALGFVEAGSSVRVIVRGAWGGLVQAPGLRSLDCEREIPFAWIRRSSIALARALELEGPPSEGAHE